jgi:hypothetical protein
MTILATDDSRVRTALETCATSLSKLASYHLEPALQHRLDDLGARKEFLDPIEHDELLALVEFSQRRTIEALEAQVALRRLREAFPDAGVIP